MVGSKCNCNSNMAGPPSFGQTFLLRLLRRTRRRAGGTTRAKIFERSELFAAYIRIDRLEFYGQKTGKMRGWDSNALGEVKKKC
jgi:hypothetical protein